MNVLKSPYNILKLEMEKNVKPKILVMRGYIRRFDGFSLRNQHDVIHDWTFDRKFGVEIYELPDTQEFEDNAQALWTKIFFEMIAARQKDLIVADLHVFSADPEIAVKIEEYARLLGITVVVLTSDKFIPTKSSINEETLVDKN